MNLNTKVALGIVLATIAVTATATALGVFDEKDAKAVGNTTRALTDNHQAGNWNFETGALSGWQTSATGSGAWHVYADGTTPPVPADSDRDVPFKVPQPPEGQFAAITDMRAPGSRILYRDVKLDESVMLQLTVFYDNHGGEFSAPANLRSTGCEPNQQFRVDLMDPTAPVDSLADKHVLANIFRTAPGAPPKLGPQTITFNLSRWAGEQVRIRLAQVDNHGPLRAGVDDVRLQPIEP